MKRERGEETAVETKATKLLRCGSCGKRRRGERERKSVCERGGRAEKKEMREREREEQRSIFPTNRERERGDSYETKRERELEK